MRGFLTALSFLTRFGLAKRLDSAAIAESVPWYPAAGIIVGALCSLPVILGICSGYPWVQSWLYVLLYFWITMGLHWDGLADLTDAWASGASGQKFWDILYDSRCGAFGATGLILGLSGQLILIKEHVAAGLIFSPLLAPAFGRGAIISLAAVLRPKKPDSLGALAFAGASLKMGLLNMAGIFAAVSLFVSPWRAAALLACFAFTIAALARMARGHGGGNGDFLGSGIILCELETLLLTLP